MLEIDIKQKIYISIANGHFKNTNMLTILKEKIFNRKFFID